MKMIFKYQIRDVHHNSIQEIEMPKGAKIISSQMQNGELCLWAIVNPKHSIKKRTFHIFGTGFEMVDYDKKLYEHVATVQQPMPLHSLNLVWHVFEVFE